MKKQISFSFHVRLSPTVGDMCRQPTKLRHLEANAKLPNVSELEGEQARRRKTTETYNCARSKVMAQMSPRLHTSPNNIMLPHY